MAVWVPLCPPVFLELSIPRSLRPYTPCYLLPRGFKLVSYGLGYTIGLCIAPAAMTAAALAGFMAANMLPEEDGAPDALYAALYGALGAGFLALGPMPRCIGDKTILFGLRMCAAARQALGLPDITSIRKGSRLVEPGKGKGEKAARRKRRGEYDPEYDTHWVTLAPELEKEKLPFDPFFESIRAPRYVDFKKQGVDLKREDLPEGIEDFTSDSWDQDEVGCWFCKVGLR